MVLICNCVTVDILAIVIAIVIGIGTYFHWAFGYWKRKNIPYIEPKFPFGTTENPFSRKEHISVRFKTFYNKLKSEGAKHVGLYMFTRPMYLVIDQQYVKNIMCKDFQHFTDRGVYYNERDDPLSAHLLNLEGNKWKHLRHKLTPTFAIGKVKMMFQTIATCGDQLIDAVDDILKDNKVIDVKDVLGRFTTDVIGSCAFGIDCNSFKNPNSDFRRYGKKIFSPVTRFQAIKKLVVFTNQNLARRLRIIMFSSEAKDFFLNVVKDTVEYREKSKSTRKDFMQLLIDLKNGEVGNNGDDKKYGNGLTIEQIAAQVFVFFLAASETSSTTMTFCLFELAQNPDIQQRIRDELNDMFEESNGKMTYDTITELKYLDQVINETLRKYPPAAFLPRVCVQDYKIPDTDETLEKGTIVIIPVLGLHHDPEFFPDPEKFDPDRFSDENKKNIVPYTYIPFGEGPRICIGARFGFMQTKVGLAALLKNYKFTLNKKTKVPLVINPFSFILTAQGGIWLNLEKIDT